MQPALFLLAVSRTDTAPPQPASVSLSTYSGALVRVTWVNAVGGFQTKVYRASGGSWLLLTTVAAGVTSYDTGLSSSNNYTYGVAHHAPSSGLTSAVLTAEPLPPPTPTNVITSLYAGTKVQVNWTSTGQQTRGYRRLGAGAWVLRTTIAAGTSAWQTGDQQSAGYTHGVAGFNGVSESSIVTASGGA